MDPEKLSLSWKEFDYWTSKTFKDLRDDKCYTDVTLATGDHQIKAHKIVLSSCSSFFKKVFQSTSHQMPFIYLKGIKPQHLEALLDFIYIGETEISSSEVEQFLEAAEMLEIQGLVKHEQNDTKESTPQELIRGNENKLLSPTNNSEINQFYQEELWNDHEASNALIIDEDRQYGPVDNYETRTIPTLLQCDDCDYKTVRKDMLKNHKMVVHQGIKFPCDKCSYKASHKSHLNRHVQSVHDGVRYPCDQCEFKATQQVHLREHKHARHSDNIIQFK